MSLLNSKFDIVSVDNPVALAALAQVLPVNSPPSPSVGTNGTPTAGVIPPGAMVVLNTSGKAVLATTLDLTMVDPQCVFVTIDGNTDFSGAFVQKLTCLHGGVTIKTDQYDAGAYLPGLAVTVNNGKIKLKSAATQQIVGFVGPNGLDAVEGVLEVMLVQGGGV
jgi:uncharacterized protein YaiE (UPF0345 family)